MDRYYAKSFRNKLGISTDDEKELDLNFTLKTRNKNDKNIYEDVFPESDGEIDMGPSYLRMSFKHQDQLEWRIPLSKILLSHKDKIE